MDNAVTASKLQKSDNQITTNDGFRLQVRVRPGAPPTCEMNDAMKERLKQAMTKRYLVESNALDLSRFHLDPGLCYIIVSCNYFRELLFEFNCFFRTCRRLLLPFVQAYHVNDSVGYRRNSHSELGGLEFRRKQIASYRPAQRSQMEV